jgi:hypothetical protein
VVSGGGAVVGATVVAGGGAGWVVGGVVRWGAVVPGALAVVEGRLGGTEPELAFSIDGEVDNGGAWLCALAVVELELALWTVVDAPDEAAGEAEVGAPVDDEPDGKELPAAVVEVAAP